MQFFVIFYKMDVFCFIDFFCVLNVGMCVQVAGIYEKFFGVVYVLFCFLCFIVVYVNKRDIIFFLDGSFNVGEINFFYVRDFVMNIVNSFDVGSDNIRVGLV